LLTYDVVPLECLREEKYANVLCYPRYDTHEVTKRIRQLKRLGIKAVEFAGDKSAFNLQILGKGCVGIVIIAYRDTNRIALKIRRVDSDRKGMKHEAEMLAKANAIGIGPRFIDSSEDFLLMEFVEGMHLPVWVMNIKGRGAKKRIRRVLREILEQCLKLDQIDLDHGELTNASKHIILDSQEKPHIVDFETASTARRASNVTSVCQYLFLGSELAKTLRRKLGEINNGVLVAALREYKRKHTDQSFIEILHTSGVMQ
jgi:putative serine/threonine protein kinase